MTKVHEQSERIPLKVFSYERQLKSGVTIYRLYCFTQEAVEFLQTMKSTGMLFNGGNWNKIREYRRRGEMELETEKEGG